MWTRKRHQEESTLDMTPLVDVVFLLIIFFMLSTTFIVLPGLKIELPRAASEKVEVERKKIVISVDSKGAFYLDKDSVDDAELKRRLAQIAADNPQTLILIEGDRNSRYGRSVDLLDMIRRAGLYRIAIVTQRKKEGSQPQEGTK